MTRHSRGWIISHKIFSVFAAVSLLFLLSVAFVVIDTIKDGKTGVVIWAGFGADDSLYKSYSCKRYELLSPYFEEWGVNHDLDLARTRIIHCPDIDGMAFVTKAIRDDRYAIRNRAYRIWIRGRLQIPGMNNYVVEQLIDRGPIYFEKVDSPERTLGIVKFMFGGECRTQIQDFLQKYEPIMEIDPTRLVNVKIVSSSHEYDIIRKSCPHTIEESRLIWR